MSGAWGTSSFENDDAEQWLEELQFNDSLYILSCTFEMVENGFLDSTDACNAVAAAEVVAAIKGKPRDNLPFQALLWANNHIGEKSDHLVQEAIFCLDCITTDSCELNALWQRSNDYQNWLKDVNELKQTLQRLPESIRN